MATLPVVQTEQFVAPITDGGSPNAIVVDVFNAMWKNAMVMANSSTDVVNKAIDLAQPAPKMVGVELDKSYLLPVKPDLPDYDPLDGEAMYSAKQRELIDMIQSELTGFINKYFPNTAYYDAALDWCHEAFTTGGTGINTQVESALWERGRARILQDSARAQDEAVHFWANRRFPQPPGMLVHQMQQIELDAGRKLAEQSRDISIKSFETEVENVRIAVDHVLQQRKVALDAAGDYIRTLMLGPDTAMKLATSLASMRSDLARNLTAMYQAEVAAAEPRIRLAITDAQLKQQVNEMNLKSEMATIDAIVRAALADAEMKARQTASGLNALNASTGISGSAGTSVSYSYGGEVTGTGVPPVTVI